MSARLRQYRLLWQAAHAQAHPRAGIILWSIIAVLTVAVTAIAGALYGARTAFGWALATPAAVLLFDWTMAFIPGALCLNLPANAQLVPGMRRRLIELALLVWLAAIGLLAAGLQSMPEPSHVFLLSAMAMSLGMATIMAGVNAGMLLMLPFFIPLFGGSVQQWLREAAAQPGVMPLLATILTLLGVPAVRSLFPQGGERHWAMLDLRARLGGNKSNVGLFTGLDRYLPQRLLQRRMAATRAPGALLLRALGHDLFALTAWGTLGAALSLAGITWHLRTTSAAEDPVPMMLMTGGIMVCFVFPLAAVPGLLTHTRGEQALVRLAPVAPIDPARFNALLARTMLRQGLAIWAWVAAVTVMLAFAGGMRGMDLAWQACGCCMTLPALAIVLRDHARRPRWNMMLYGLVVLALSCVGPVAGMLGARQLGLPFWPTATITALMLTVVLVRHRWRLMCAAPCAFPVARLD